MLKSKRSVKVLHVIDSAGYGGGERYVADIIRHASPGVEHTVAVPYQGPLAAQLDKHGFSYRVIDMESRFSPSTVLQLSRWIRKARIHVVHSHGFRANIYSRLAAMLAGRSHAFTMHVSLYDYVDTPLWLRRIYIIAEALTSVLTRRCICISGAMREDALRMGIGKSKIILIPNGVDVRRFRPGKSLPELRRELGIDGNGPVIGAVGRLVTEKGQKYLIEALAGLKKTFPDIICLLIGQGPLLIELKAQAAGLGLSDTCLFAGGREDMERIYPLMDIFVLPSLREPFGLALLEAMSSGVPAIATAAGGPMDFIRSGENGILVPPRDPRALSDAMTDLLSSPMKRKYLADKSLKSVTEHFRIETMVARLESEYRRMAT